MKPTAHRTQGIAIAAPLLVLVCMGTPAGEPSKANGPRSAPPLHVPVGGVNSAKPAPPPTLAIPTKDWAVGSFAVRVPTGTYEAPKKGVPRYSIPGPIVAFRGVDNKWRGHGYLETYPRLIRFKGSVEEKAATLVYEFEGGKQYRVVMTAGENALLMEETSTLGPRNLYVFDAFYGDWRPSSGFAVDQQAKHHGFLYLPCYYDKAEVTVNPFAASKTPPPGAVAIVSSSASKRDVAGFWVRNTKAWKNGDRMGFQLWQRRQRPGDPASRLFLGPDTKSDSTPNPKTAPLMGTSLYEGHVTIEFSLGNGSRNLGFAVTAKGEKPESIPEGFKSVMRKGL